MEQRGGLVNAFRLGELEQAVEFESSGLPTRSALIEVVPQGQNVLQHLSTESRLGQADTALQQARIGALVSFLLDLIWVEASVTTVMSFFRLETFQPQSGSAPWQGFRHRAWGPRSRSRS